MSGRSRAASDFCIRAGGGGSGEGGDETGDDFDGVVDNCLDLRFSRTDFVPDVTSGVAGGGDTGADAGVDILSIGLSSLLLLLARNPIFLGIYVPDLRWKTPPFRGL